MRKRLYFYEKLEILPRHSLTKALPWQHPRLLSTKTVSYDALYNYTKSQKISSAYCKPFWHSKAKACREGEHCSLNRVKAVQSLENICASVYSSSHIGEQKNAHQPIFPHNIIGNFPTSWATNSAFNGPNDFGMETYHMILQVKIWEKRIIICIIVFLMISYENHQISIFVQGVSKTLL